MQPNTVECSINAGDESFLNSVQVRQERDALRISFPPPVFRTTDAHLRLGVPPGLEYVIKVGSADVSMSADIGRSKITSGSGDISVGRARDLDCSTGSGDVSVGRLAGSGARLSSGSGDVTVGEVRCPVTAKSGSGDVTVARCGRTTSQASSGSGDITVASTSGSVDLRTASGSLTVGVADGLPAWLDLDSVSGGSGSRWTRPTNPRRVRRTSRSGPARPPATSRSTAPRPPSFPRNRSQTAAPSGRSRAVSDPFRRERRRVRSRCGGS